jgi:hypothetical protein
MDETRAMANWLPIRCACGTVRAHADLRDHDARRAVCYCRDCRMFAYFLGQADTTLDAHGGTEVVQMSQGRLHFEAGHDRLACMRLTPKGLLRWYAGCCHTPIGNVPPNRHLPYLGLIHTCIDFGGSGASADACIGPIDCRVHAQDPRVRQAFPEAHERIPPGVLIRVAGRVIRWRLRGDHLRSPFFAPDTGVPVARPRVLGADERNALTGR